MFSRSTTTLLTALVIFGFSVLAYAGQNTEVNIPSGYVDWATVAFGMGSIILTLVTGILIHVNSQITKLSDTLWKRVVDNEQQLETLHKTLLREYHTKADLREVLNITMQPLMEKLTSLSGDMDAVYRELLRTNKRSGDSHEHSQKSHS